VANKNAQVMVNIQALVGHAQEKIDVAKREQPGGRGEEGRVKTQ